MKLRHKHNDPEINWKRISFPSLHRKALKRGSLQECHCRIQAIVCKISLVSIITYNLLLQ